jgi:hypothetical protein
MKYMYYYKQATNLCLNVLREMQNSSLRLHSSKSSTQHLPSEIFHFAGVNMSKVYLHGLSLPPRFMLIYCTAMCKYFDTTVAPSVEGEIYIHRRLTLAITHHR